MDELSYPIVVMEVPAEDGGGFAAFAPDLPGCMGDGSTRAEALADVESAIGEWLDEAARRGQTVPLPGSAARHASQNAKDPRVPGAPWDQNRDSDWQQT